MPLAGQKRKRDCSKHPYLSGNFAPIHQQRPLTPCTYAGTIPEELVGGQYVRNGGNPISNEDLGRDAHWFDGDGMLAGVHFRRSEEKKGDVVPEFVNQYIMTDLYLASISSPRQRLPLLPSIATLVNPASSLITIMLRIMRTIFLVILSHLPGSQQAVKKISVANTAILYHDGRALATCESGPPMRVSLPGLETVGWYDGNRAEGEKHSEKKEVGFGGEGLLSWMKEWTTGHPKVDPVTKEMILYHCTFAPPYVHYSIIPSEDETDPSLPKLLNAPVSGVSGGKMMHDFGVSREHSIIMDLPLSLDPLNLLKNRPILSYDSSAPARFGVFKRRDPSNVHWFETSACCIFHTANAWDTYNDAGEVESVNLLVARLTTATLVYSAGNIAAPQPTAETIKKLTKPISFFDKYDDYDDENATFRNACAYDRAPALESPSHEKSSLLPLTSSPTPAPEQDQHQENETEQEDEQCRLYTYTFALPHTAANPTPHPLITAQHALSAIPFEFPAVHPARAMQAARFIYGCSTSSGSMTAALGRAVKIDVLAKIDAGTLLARAAANPPPQVVGCVDSRSVGAVLKSTDPEDPVRCFRMPEGWYAQEARFVPRKDAQREDDGWLLFYAFDERQLDGEGECGVDARSELWVLDARGMREVVCKVALPQRVPYGLHGEWFGEGMVRGQRGVEGLRGLESPKTKGNGVGGLWMEVRRRVEEWLG